jgi:hypothetical protein
VSDSPFTTAQVEREREAHPTINSENVAHEPFSLLLRESKANEPFLIAVAFYAESD